MQKAAGKTCEVKPTRSWVLLRTCWRRGSLLERSQVAAGGSSSFCLTYRHPSLLSVTPSVQEMNIFHCLCFCPLTSITAPLISLEVLQWLPCSGWVDHAVTNTAMSGTANPETVALVDVVNLVVLFDKLSLMSVLVPSSSPCSACSHSCVIRTHSLPCPAAYLPHTRLLRCGLC